MLALFIRTCRTIYITPKKPNGPCYFLFFLILFVPVVGFCPLASMSWILTVLSHCSFAILILCPRDSKACSLCLILDP